MLRTERQRHDHDDDEHDADCQQADAGVASPATAAATSTPTGIFSRLPSLSQLLLALFAVACCVYLRTVDLPQGRLRTTPTGPTSRPAATAPTTRPTTRASAAATNAAAAAVDPLFASQLTALADELTVAHKDDGPLSLLALGASISFSAHELRNGFGLRAQVLVREQEVATTNAHGGVTGALTGASKSPVLPDHKLVSYLRRLALSNRFVRSGDAVADDPRNSFNQDHRHCAKQRKASRGSGNGGVRCRQAVHANLEALFRDQPGAVWQLLQEALVEEVEARVRDNQQPDAPYSALRRAKLRSSGLLQVDIVRDTAKKP